MRRDDQLWQELHDLEKRVYRIEDQAHQKLAVEHALMEAKEKRRQRLQRPLRVVPIVISVVSTVLLMLSRIHII